MNEIKFESVDGIELDATFSKTNKVLADKILLIHGITASKSEGGIYNNLALQLNSIGFDVLQFSFRGHGKSDGTQRGMTIAGEMLDTLSAIRYLQSNSDDQIYICAASFGAVSTCVLLPQIEPLLKGLILWNPVLDLKDTFLDPSLEWGKTNFNPNSFNFMRENDFLLIDNSFQAGKILFHEMKYYNPYNELLESSLNTLILHGNLDKYVSYECSKRISKISRKIELITVEGSDHGFEGKKNEDFAIKKTIEWLQNQ